MHKLTERTLIPLGIAIIAIGGGAAWLTNVNASIRSIEAAQNKYTELVEQIRNDLAEIKGELKRIKR